MQGSRTKVLTVAAAAAAVREMQTRGEIVVLCHGCFDIVHPGHVRHLQQAAKLGTRLMVTVSGDGVVGKGAGRPLIPQELRAENLAALDCVSWVAISELPTAAELLEVVRPDVYVKGSEYEQSQDPRFERERRVVESYGGRVVFTSGDVIFSSTALVQALEEAVHPGHAALRRFIEQHALTADTLESIVQRFSGRRVLIVGEPIIDTYVMCDQPVVAGESPVMTLRPVEYRSFDGGAAIVARHVAAMGARPTLLMPLPATPDAESFRLRLEVEGVEVHAVPVDERLSEKQRFLVGTSKVMKLDLGEPIVLDTHRRQQVVETARELARACDAFIAADFGLGFFTAPMLRSLCRAVRSEVMFAAGDVSGRRSNLLSMVDMDLLCPSEMEVRSALHDYENGLSAVVWQLLEQTGARAAMVTLGDEGLIAFDHPPHRVAGDGRLRASHVPSLVAHATDQLGCGDALIAAATLTMIAGGAVPSAAALGSLAAVAQTQKLGNAVIGSADLRRGIRRLFDGRLTFDPEPSAARIPLFHDHLSASNAESS